MDDGRTAVSSLSRVSNPMLELLQFAMSAKIIPLHFTCNHLQNSATTQTQQTISTKLHSHATLNKFVTIKASLSVCSQQLHSHNWQEHTTGRVTSLKQQSSSWKS